MLKSVLQMELFQRTNQLAAETVQKQNALLCNGLLQVTFPECINSAKPSESKLNMDKLALFNNLKTYDFEESLYVKSMAAETGKIISMSYCKTCESRIRFYWLSALKGKFIG